MVLITVHNVFPAIAAGITGAISYSALNYFGPASYDKFPLFGSLIPPGTSTATINACDALLLATVTFVLYRRRLFRKFPTPFFNTRPENIVVGVREVAGDRSVGRPPITVFYTAKPPSVTDFSKNNSKNKDSVPWLPKHDLRFNTGFMRFVTEISGKSTGFGAWALHTFLSFLFRHTGDLKLEASLDAPAEISPDGFGSGPSNSSTGKKSRIFVMCHGMAGNGHMHSDLVKEILSALGNGGGVVLCPNWTDGTSGFAFRDANDMEGIMIENGEAINDKQPPTAKEIQQRERQLTARLKELNVVLKFAADRGEKTGLVATLFPGDAPKQNSFLDTYFVKNGKLYVRLVGHSNGGALVTAATLDRLDGDGSCAIEAVLALDAWMTPLNSRRLALGANDKKQEKFELPPFLFSDSEQWEKWTLNKASMEELVQNWPGKAGGYIRREFIPGTDHLTAMDHGRLFTERRKFVQVEKTVDVLRAWARQIVTL